MRTLARMPIGHSLTCLCSSKILTYQYSASFFRLNLPIFCIIFSSQSTDILHHFSVSTYRYSASIFRLNLPIFCISFSSSSKVVGNSVKHFSQTAAKSTPTCVQPGQCVYEYYARANTNRQSMCARACACMCTCINIQANIHLTYTYQCMCSY